MTRKQRSQLDKAIERAHAQDIRLVAVLGTPECPIYYTTSSAGESKLYKVTRPYGGQELQCNCQATGICKHRAIVHEHLISEYEAMQEPTYTAESEHTDAAQQPWENQANAEAAYAARLAYNKVMYAAERAEEEAKRRETALLDTGLRFDPQTGLALTEREVA